MIDYSYLKINFSPINHINSQMKKRKISVDNAALQVLDLHTKIFFSFIMIRYRSFIIIYWINT